MCPVGYVPEITLGAAGSTEQTDLRAEVGRAVKAAAAQTGG